MKINIVNIELFLKTKTVETVKIFVSDFINPRLKSWVMNTTHWVVNRFNGCSNFSLIMLISRKSKLYRLNFGIL